MKTLYLELLESRTPLSKSPDIMSANPPPPRSFEIRSPHAGQPYKPRPIPRSPMHPLHRAFTLVEVLMVVGVLAIIGGIAIVTVADSRESTRVSKLESDVATINAAIQVHAVNGGALPEEATPQQILEELKKSASAATAPTIAGLRGSMVDLRLKAESQTEGEAATSQPRAIWNGERFVVVSEGGAGVKNFVFDDVLAKIDRAPATRTATVKTGTGDWVWDYADVDPVAQTNSIAGPNAGTNPDGTPLDSTPARLLLEPIFEPGESQQPLSQFDPELQVTLLNPNDAGTSQIYVGNALYTGPFWTGPGVSISAQAKTSDPDHWITSMVATKSYQAIPVSLSVAVNAPASLTYAQAGGAMTDGSTATPPSATFSIAAADAVPSRYMNSGNFGVTYSLNGVVGEETGEFSGGYVSPAIPLGVGHWGPNTSSLSITAQVVSKNSIFVAGDPTTRSVGIAVTELPPASIDPPSGVKASDLPVDIAVESDEALPVGYRIFYTLDGTDPGNISGNPSNGFLYTGQFNSGAGINGVVQVRARVYGPSGYGQWFTPGPLASTTYYSITLANGALVGSATLNGTFVGSLVYASPSSGNMGNITFNANAKILKGNLYLPGTPTVRLSNGTTWSTATDAAFSSSILGWEFDAAGERTVQTTPRVINENGNPEPSNYSVQFNNTALLEGKIIRRHDAPAFPTIDPPPPSDSNGSLSLNNPPSGPISASQYANVNINTSAVGDVRLNSGNYGNLNANNGTAFVLGDPDNPEVTQYYSFKSLNLNSSSDLKIVGKVIITLSGSININNGSVLGNPDHPDWMQLQFSSGNLDANSGSAIYGQIVIPTGGVSFNAGSIFQGSVTANNLTINSNSVVFNLPPVVQPTETEPEN